MLSDSALLSVGAHFFAVGFIGFGVLWFVDIPKSLSFFELPHDSVATSKTIQAVAIAYGARELFMGFAISASALYGTKKMTGLLLVAAGLVAAADGFACWHVVGDGQWGHWSYAPLVIANGLTLLGLLDKSKSKPE